MSIFILLFFLFLAYHFAYHLYWHSIRPTFKGKRVFITGASSGIGEQLAKRFAQLGASVIVLASRRVPELERVKKECEVLLQDKVKQKLIVQQLDLSDPEKCLKFAQDYDQPIDILINNGGISQRDWFLSTDFKVAQQLMNINCMSPIALIKGMLPRMVEQQKKEGGGGHIVNVLSLAGILGVPIRSYYSTSKFALDGFGKALQAETAHLGITVTQCYPAYVKTQISRNAMVGSGEQFGKTDANIENGLSVEEATEDLIKAIYIKRYWIVLGSMYYQVLPRMVQVSEYLSLVMGKMNFKQQKEAKEMSKDE